MFRFHDFEKINQEEEKTLKLPIFSLSFVFSVTVLNLNTFWSRRGRLFYVQLSR